MSNMTLRRADILKLTDMSARPFDAMIMRGQAPWSPRDMGRAWGEFTTEDGYRVALVHAMIRQNASYEDAGRTLRAEFDELITVKSSAPGDLLFGTFITEMPPQESEPGVRLHLVVVAPETEWLAEVLRIKELVAGADEMIGFSAINATAIMRRTLAKADAAGLRDSRLTKLAKKVRAL